MNTLARLHERFNRELSRSLSASQISYLRHKYHRLYMMAYCHDIRPTFRVTGIEELYFDRFPRLIPQHEEEYWMVPELVQSTGEIDVFHAVDIVEARRILNARARAAGKPWRLYKGSRFLGTSEEGNDGQSDITPRIN